MIKVKQNLSNKLNYKIILKNDNYILNFIILLNQPKIMF